MLLDARQQTSDRSPEPNRQGKVPPPFATIPDLPGGLSAPAEQRNLSSEQLQALKLQLEHDRYLQGQQMERDRQFQQQRFQLALWSFVGYLSVLVCLALVTVICTFTDTDPSGIERFTDRFFQGVTSTVVAIIAYYFGGQISSK